MSETRILLGRIIEAFDEAGLDYEVNYDSDSTCGNSDSDSEDGYDGSDFSPWPINRRYIGNNQDADFDNLLMDNSVIKVDKVPSFYDEGWKYETVIDNRVADRDIYPDDFAKLVDVDFVTSFIETTRKSMLGDFEPVYIKVDFYKKLITYYIDEKSNYEVPEHPFINFSDGYFPIEDDTLYRIDCSKLKVAYKIDNGYETTDKIKLKDEIIYVLPVKSCGCNVFVRMDSQLAPYIGYCSDEFTLYIDNHKESFNVVLFKEDIITLKNAQRRS